MKNHFYDAISLLAGIVVLPLLALLFAGVWVEEKLTEMR